MERYSTVGKTGNVDDYINPGASDELPLPPELADDKEHIRKLQEDVQRSGLCIGQRDGVIKRLQRENKALKEKVRQLEARLAGKSLEPDGDKPTVTELRIRKGLSVREMARRAGLSYYVVYQRERREYVWRDEQKKAVAGVLGVAVDSVDWDG